MRYSCLGNGGWAPNRQLLDAVRSSQFHTCYALAVQGRNPMGCPRRFTAVVGSGAFWLRRSGFDLF